MQNLANKQEILPTSRFARKVLIRCKWVLHLCPCWRQIMQLVYREDWSHPYNKYLSVPCILHRWQYHHSFPLLMHASQPSVQSFEIIFQPRNEEFSQRINVVWYRNSFQACKKTSGGDDSCILIRDSFLIVDRGRVSVDWEKRVVGSKKWRFILCLPELI